MSRHKMKLFIATSNAGKLRELLLLIESDCELAELIEPITPRQVGLDIDFEEHGESHIEIAKRKAVHAAKVSGLPSLAEDSGLEIDALDGFPGSRSARFMGRATSYDIKNDAILEMLSSIPEERRTARYRCAMALATADELISAVEDEVEGLIAFKAIGEGGFGYDPIFYLPGLGFTMAQLPIEVKNAISHRGRAFRRIACAIKELANRIQAHGK